MSGSNSITEGGQEQPPEKRVPLGERHPPLGWVLSRFHLDLDALREMLDEFVPLAVERARKRAGSEAISQLGSLDPERQDKLRRFLDAAADRALRGEKPGPSSPEEPVLREIFENDRHSLLSLVLGIQKQLVGPSRIAIVHNSLLTQAISAFEVLVSGIATRFYVEHSNALGTDIKEFSLAELRTFADIDDAADALIALRVSSLMFGGLDDWAAWFKKFVGDDLSVLAMQWGAVVEAFQRRHVVIHNGGLVSRQYLARVPNSEAQLGERLEIDGDYLRNVFDQLDVLGTLVGVRTWGRWHQEERENSAGTLLQRSYELMLLSRWHAASSLCDAAQSFDCAAAQKEALRVNGWNSKAEIHGLDHVRGDVDDWDVSALANRFKLAKLALLGELELASALADELLERKELERGELAEWPVLRGLREHRAQNP